MNLQQRIETIPYAVSLGIMVLNEEEFSFKIPYQNKFIGNYILQAWHGGVLCSFLEISATLSAMKHSSLEKMPKVINVNYNFFRPALAKKDLFVQNRLVKAGKRILHIEGAVYQDTLEKPCAILHSNFLIAQA